MLVEVQEDSLGWTLISTNHVTHASLFREGDIWWANVEVSTGRMLVVYVTDAEKQEAAGSLLIEMLAGE